jgi:hypothetical protein
MTKKYELFIACLRVVFRGLPCRAGAVRGLIAMSIRPEAPSLNM